MKYRFILEGKPGSAKRAGHGREKKKQDSTANAMMSCIT
jgi:hypothetical protein